MSEKWGIVWSVTQWEFNRFFKWADMVKGVAYMVLFGLIGGGVSFWLTSESTETPEVAVADYGVFNPEGFEMEGVRFLDQSNVSAADLLVQLEDGQFDAVLTVISADSAVIRMQNDRGWLMSLRQFLQEKRTDYKLGEFGIDETAYAEIQQGMELHAQFDRGSESSNADKFVAGISIFLVLMAVFMSFAYQFTAITAEKQQRITEQVISAINPQTWIDGKILGITGVGLVYVIFYGGLGLLVTALMVRFAGAPFGEALTLIDPLLLIIFLILSLLGILMWNSFMAAVAATIDDPNSSERSGLMFLPMLPVMFAFFTLVNPDTFAITMLGIFPLTSYAVLPARMVLTQVAWWEPVLALLLLAVTVWLFRVIAGKIFATGMMMYGKEPTIREMVYWFKRS